MTPLSDKSEGFVSFTEINTITNEAGQNKRRTEEKQANLTEGGRVLCTSIV